MTIDSRFPASCELASCPGKASSPKNELEVGKIGTRGSCPNRARLVLATPKPKLRNGSGVFGNAAGMLSVLCSGFRGRLLFVA